MSRYIDADALMIDILLDKQATFKGAKIPDVTKETMFAYLDSAPSIDIVICEDCRKSHIDGKTTHYLWCTEWGRSTDVFGYCERGEREGE